MKKPYKRKLFQDDENVEISAGTDSESEEMSEGEDSMAADEEPMPDPDSRSLYKRKLNFKGMK